MRNTGVSSFVLGILILVTGITFGVLSIINGAALLKEKNEITF